MYFHHVQVNILIGFDKLLKHSRRGAKDTYFVPSRLLAIDPGETIGWSLFIDGDLYTSGQIKSTDNPSKAIEGLFDETLPTMVVFEDYRIYPNKSDEHIMKHLYTPEMLGMIEMMCYLRDIPHYRYLKSNVSVFCSDEKLKAWGFYNKGVRHARDSIRHGAYFLLFNKEYYKEKR